MNNKGVCKTAMCSLGPLIKYNVFCRSIIETQLNIFNSIYGIGSTNKIFGYTC